MVLGRNNKKDKRNLSLALQMNETILDVIRSINTGDDKEIVAVRCPDCHMMVRNFNNHGCSGGAA